MAEEKKKPSWPPVDMEPPEIGKIPEIMKRAKNAAGKNAKRFFSVFDGMWKEAEYKEAGCTYQVGDDKNKALQVFAGLLPFYCWEIGDDGAPDYQEMAAKMLSIMDKTAFRSAFKDDEWNEQAPKATKAAIEAWNKRGRACYGTAKVHWFSTFKNGRPKTTVIQNTAALLEYKSVTCRKNLLTREIEFCGAGLDGKDFDDAITYLCSMAAVLDDNISEKTMKAHILALAAGNAYSPAAEWFTACGKRYETEWMDIDAIKAAFACLELNPAFEQEESVCYMMFRKWFIQVAAMTLNLKGEYGADGILILQGDGGIGKTQFARSLLPFKEWIETGRSIDPSDKDSIDQATTTVITEFGEFGENMKLRNVNKLKQFVTNPTDTYRKAYGRRKESFPRLTTFIGTINEPEFLKDPTGNRRYWPIAVNEIHWKDLPSLEQLWGQATYLFTHGESFRLTKEDREALARNQLNMECMTEEMLVLRDCLMFDVPVDSDGKNPFWHYRTLTEIRESLGDRGRGLTNRGIGAALRKMAETDKRIKPPTNHMGWRFFVPDTKPSLKHEKEISYISGWR
ncbi:VapE domain-containing protein [uncultured Selenomonas sp.]|uniref:VapE domain-containing protein n=1 Tax=uncultured Selenomonas sp. TaxID=159275 RepID=UPI0025F7970C|nr:VapE domain-containing protein [uncultured Selenomonas sp.]